MAYHHDYLDLKYPPLKPGETRKRKIHGVTVIQRHDWTKIRHKEIDDALRKKPREACYKSEHRKQLEWAEMTREAEERAAEVKANGVSAPPETPEHARLAQQARADRRRADRAARLAQRRGAQPCS